MHKIGFVINTSMKPGRDVMVGIVELLSEAPRLTPTFFHASSATTPENLVEFASSGLDGMIICGVRRKTVLSFLRSMRKHPPVVVCTYLPVEVPGWERLGPFGVVLMDNDAVGRMAAKFFLNHGLRNFAFLGCNVSPENVCPKIRENGFRKCIADNLKNDFSYSRLMIGHVDDATEDFWEVETEDVVGWLKRLPLPCGVFVDGDYWASFKLYEACQSLEIKIPDRIEALGVDGPSILCELIKPPLSVIHPDHALCARQAVELIVKLIADPKLPRDESYVTVDSMRIAERGSTSSKGSNGVMVARMREFIRLNACKGIGIPDIAQHMGMSRRTLEKHMRDATGCSLLETIQKIRLDNVCRLLETTNLGMSEVAMRSGYGVTSNLIKLFKSKFGMTMREYRISHNNAAANS